MAESLVETPGVRHPEDVRARHNFALAVALPVRRRATAAKMVPHQLSGRPSARFGDQEPVVPGLGQLQGPEALPPRRGANLPDEMRDRRIHVRPTGDG